MNSPPGDAAYEPRLYRAPVGILWWLRRRSYFFFVLRELSTGPPIWRGRVVPWSNQFTGRAQAAFLEPHDCVVSKLVAD